MANHITDLYKRGELMIVNVPSEPIFNHVTQLGVYSFILRQKYTDITLCQLDWTLIFF